MDQLVKTACHQLARRGIQALYTDPENENWKAHFLVMDFGRDLRVPQNEFQHCRCEGEIIAVWKDKAEQIAPKWFEEIEAPRRLNRR